MIRKYLNEIIDIAKSGDSTELSYYSSLENLIKEYAKTKNLEITVITIPKKTEVGYPDFKILSGVSKFIGCIEAKSTIYENLDSIVGTEQLKKYKTTFPNLILTNFYEFRLYRNGTQICKTQITFPPLDIQTPAALRKEKEFCNLLDRFLDFSIPKITTSEKLAEELAKRTKFLKEDIMKVDEIKNNNNIKGFYNAFKEYLVPDLDNEQFADLLSQTITYSLFASRTRIKDRESDKFSRKVAYENIPHRTLRDIFRYISQEK
ncbi:MAG: DNA methyltransferase, partial [Candidatus Stahlbacteria bacterium]|nr:DNA methyltransferase [Candidatus Stahlbacteria bacterium]